MGHEQSKSQPNRVAYASMHDSFSYAPVTTYRTEATYSARFQGDNFNTGGANLTDQPVSLLNTAYYGKWSMELSHGISPVPRIGQCCVHDPVTDSLVIAYGLDSDGNFLDDCWALHLATLQWRRIREHCLSPREYPSAVLLGRKMVVFGGACGSTFFSDLHFIDLDTGEINIVSSHGRQPVPRTSPAMFSFNDHIYLWAGFDGRAHGGIYRISPNNQHWHRFDVSHTGVPAPAYCVHKGVCYVFGGVTGTPISTFDPQTGQFTPVTCTGTEPTHELTHASLVSADEYIFLIGGESTVKFMHIYALDVKRKWWFAFHVRPDNQSLSLADGIINKVGLFMLPREHSCSVAYSSRERALVSVMGSRMVNPAPVFRISLGLPLAALHLRNDMLDLFTYDHGQK
ncbi:Kelch motif family protein [Tritrichomonas foetus]|uniref:Kelch motif family protein n=1 Tax=Tritrichomonas foetus TaxID=1144522 RepID=A0A1J4KUX3_9EUKA|nr:Kelch motif family protein [Tritrichomonas foetus]|eukprot:OHT14922.1 Kelch motif family protein [Tritrichomonas foetus]